MEEMQKALQSSRDPEGSVPDFIPWAIIWLATIRWTTTRPAGGTLGICHPRIYQKSKFKEREIIKY
jgi:hypothetical protein